MAAIDIKVGIGCNSETFVIADNTISLHAACIAGLLKAPATSKERCGNIYLNSIRSAPYFHNVIKSISVEPFTVLQAVNDASWQIRIKTELIESMQFQLTESYPRETGGVLVGTANFKTRTIHVVSIIDAPPDSKANRVCFFRGVQGLKHSLDTISALSGGQLGYIGEWHTHPDGPNGMSEKDANTVRRFKQEFDDLPAPLPVFLMILTPSHALTYVY
jgi:integrative and conjugative element protein (TIGR02256 family)